MEFFSICRVSIFISYLPLINLENIKIQNHRLIIMIFKKIKWINNY